MSFSSRNAVDDIVTTSKSVLTVLESLFLQISIYTLGRLNFMLAAFLSYILTLSNM